MHYCQTLRWLKGFVHRCFKAGGSVVFEERAHDPALCLDQASLVVGALHDKIVIQVFVSHLLNSK
jgi:hypothetical protein